MSARPEARLAVRAHHVWELLRYGLVGVFNASLYFGLYSAGVLLGVPFALSVVVAFVLSASLGYWLHEHWTFGGSSPTAVALGKWLVAQAISIAVNLVLLTLAVHQLDADPILAQLVLMPVMPAATFLVGRRWVFTRAPASSPAA